MVVVSVVVVATVAGVVVAAVAGVVVVAEWVVVLRGVGGLGEYEGEEMREEVGATDTSSRGRLLMGMRCR